MLHFKDISRRCKTRIAEKLSLALLNSGHFRRTVLRQLFLNHVAPSAMAYVAFPDHVLIVDPRDHMIAFSLVSGNSWQRKEFEQAIELAERANALRTGGWFVDVGANIGTQTIYALLSGKFRGAVAIEPEPHNIDLLRRNMQLNGLTNRVHIVQAAASSHAGTAELIRDAENFGAHSIECNPTMRPADRISVQTRTVDEILTSLNIPASDVGLALLDVEGHEIKALQGMPTVRRHGIPIVVEVTGSIHGRRGLDELRALLASDYGLISQLRSDGGTAATKAASNLESFDFGLRQTDFLIYNDRKTAVSKAS